MILRYLLVAVTLCVCAQSQDMVQSWTAESTKSFGQEEPGATTLRVVGVNNFYYVYSTAITSKDQAQSDYDLLSAFLAQLRNKALPTNDCDQKVKKVLTDISKMTPPQLDKDTKMYSSLTLAQTQKDWNDNVAADYKDLATGQDCSKADGFAQIKDAHDRLFPLTSIPAVTLSFDAKPCKDYTITVSEFYAGVTTGKSATATFSTSCDQVTLSAGVLFTEVGNPTFVCA